MTLNDLWLTVRHYAKWVITVPLVCALVAGGLIYVLDHVREKNFVASSSLTITDSTALLGTTSILNLMDVLAQNELALASDEEMTVEAVADPATQSVVFTASGPSESGVIAAANDIADRTAALTKQALIDQGEVYLSVVDEATSEGESPMSLSGVTAADRIAALRSCAFTVSEAKEAIANGAGGALKYAAVGLVGGLFLVICALALVDSVRRPIKGETGVVAVTDVPVLSRGSDAMAGERLWLNVQFCTDKPLDSLCLMPLSGAADVAMGSVLSDAIESMRSNSLSAERLDAGCCENRPSIVCCDSLQKDIFGARAARESSAVIVIVQTWRDTETMLRDTLSELKLAGAPVVGVALTD